MELVSDISTGEFGNRRSIVDAASAFAPGKKYASPFSIGSATSAAVLPAGTKIVVSLNRRGFGA